MIDWNEIRRNFPVTETCAYFMSAAMSPPPRSVCRAIQARYERFLREGDVHWPEEMERYKSLCRRLAGLVGAGPDDIAFAPNTSTAMGIMALSFKAQAASPFNIVSMKDEFPASTVAFEHLGIPIRYVEPQAGRYPVQAVLDLVDDRTMAVVTSHVQYCTGFRQDLLTLGQELCDRSVLFIVNATQSLPIYPVDVEAMRIDAMTASLHKWGMTGHVGSLFHTSPAFRRRFPSPLCGWLSIASGEGEGIHVAKNVPFRLLDSAHRYEFGTFNLIPLLGLDEALDYMEAVGITNIRRRIRELTDYLIDRLRSLNIDIVSPIDKESERSAIVSMNLGDKSTVVLKRLEEAKVFVSLRTGYIRVAVNFFNDRNEIDRLLEVLETV